MIKPSDYKPNSPEWAMANFFDCWKRKAWKQMLDYVQLSWLVQHKEPNRVLRLSLQTLIDTEFVQMNAKTGVIASFLVNIYKRTHTLEGVYAVRLVYEGKRWGVDPNSVI